MEIVAALTTEIAGHQIQQLFQIAVERGVQGVLDAQINAHAGAAGGGEATRHPFHVGQRHVGALDIIRHRDRQQFLFHVLETGAVLGQEGAVVQALAHDDRQQRGPSGRRRSRA